MLVDRCIESILERPIGTLSPDDLRWWRDVVSKVIAYTDDHPQACRWSEPRTDAATSGPPS